MAAGLLLACVLLFPSWLYPPLTASEPDPSSLTGKDRYDAINARLKLQNDARTTLLQGLGGLAVLLCAYFTWRQLGLAKKQLNDTSNATTSQLELTREGQVTERFGRATDQLGSEYLEVRLGGIYALGRLARDPTFDRRAIAAILTAYIRHRSQWPPRAGGQDQVDRPLDEQSDELQAPAPDVQAALAVLGGGQFTQVDLEDQGDQQVPLVDLHASDLRHADLRDAHLEKATYATFTWRKRTCAVPISAERTYAAPT